MEYIVNDYNGFLFDLKDSKQLADKIIQYYKLSTKQKEELKSNCVITANRYDSELLKEHLLKFLEDTHCNK